MAGGLGKENDRLSISAIVLKLKHIYNSGYTVNVNHSNMAPPVLKDKGHMDTQNPDGTEYTYS